jgi:hypothetical protein
MDVRSPAGTGDSVWLEDYLVYDRGGEPAGTVFAVLEHDGAALARDRAPAASLTRFQTWSRLPGD